MGLCVSRDHEPKSQLSATTARLAQHDLPLNTSDQDGGQQTIACAPRHVVIDDLPVDCIQRILHCMPLNQVFVLMSVCRTWRLAAEHELTDIRSLRVQLPGMEFIYFVCGRDLDIRDASILTTGCRFQNLRRLEIMSSAADENTVREVVLRNASSLRQLDIVIRLPVVDKDGQPVVYPNLYQLRCKEVDDENITACPSLVDLTEVGREWMIRQSVMPRLRRVAVENDLSRNSEREVDRFLRLHCKALRKLALCYVPFLPSNPAAIFDNVTDLQMYELTEESAVLFPRLENLQVHLPMTASTLDLLPAHQMKSMTVFSTEVGGVAYDAVGDTAEFLTSMHRFTNLTKLYLKVRTNWDTRPSIESLFSHLLLLVDVMLECITGQDGLVWDAVVETLISTHPQIKYLYLYLSEFKPSILTDSTMETLSRLQHLELLQIACDTSMITSSGILSFLRGSSRHSIQGLVVGCRPLRSRRVKRLKDELKALNDERNGVFSFNAYPGVVNHRVIIGLKVIKRDTDPEGGSYNPSPEHDRHFDNDWWE